MAALAILRSLALTVSLLPAAQVLAQVQAQPAASSSTASTPPTMRDLRAVLGPAERALAAADYPAAHAAYARHAGRNPLAQFTLGLFEQQGWGRHADPVAACAWFERAARGHIPAAQQFWGDCLGQGIGRAVDGPAALQWYRRAAAAGVAWADCAAGALYIEGKALPRDVAQGLALCTAAAQAESPPAMLRLADYYRDGSQVPANPRLARFWYGQAAQRHHHEAQFRLGLMLSEGEGGAADVAQARFWLEHAAMEGYAPAYLPTAILYANAPTDPASGALAPSDLAKVYMWNRAARGAEHTANAVRLAEIARIDAMVLAVMPPAWQPALDQRVAEHLARFAAH
jgi:TPR repeat protein